MVRRLALAALVGAALVWTAPAEAQVRRPAQRAAKKGIVERAGSPRRQGLAAEDLVMRLVEAPPEKRRELLDDNPRFQRLPPQQRRRILNRLKQIDEMRPDERAALVERYHLFSRLEPAKRERARELYQEWSKLPAARRQMMTRAVGRLRGIDPANRPTALESEPMKERFTEAERKLIGEIVDLAPGPGR
jgi:hypothetical protein